jgi:hypothetical protein
MLTLQIILMTLLILHSANQPPNFLTFHLLTPFWCKLNCNDVIKLFSGIFSLGGMTYTPLDNDDDDTVTHD